MGWVLRLTWQSLIEAPSLLSSPGSSLSRGCTFIIRLCANRKNHLMHLADLLVLRKRASSASIIDQLKNIS